MLFSDNILIFAATLFIAGGMFRAGWEWNSPTATWFFALALMVGNEIAWDHVFASVFGW